MRTIYDKLDNQFIFGEYYWKIIKCLKNHMNNKKWKVVYKNRTITEKSV